MEVLCAKEDFFKNPTKLPLNELYFEYKRLIRVSKEEVPLEEMLQEVEKPRQEKQWIDRYEVKVEKKPALDKCWTQEERRYVEFHPFYPQFDDSENGQFLEKNQEFLETLEYLVECTYHQFWCHMACEPRVSFVIKDFLQHSIPLYATSYLNEEFLSLYDEIYSCVCSIYERLLKFDFSETEYMSEEFAVGILRGTELMNVRSILSLCYLYNNSNSQFVKRLISFCFSDKFKESYTKETTDMLLEISEELDRFGSGSLALQLSPLTDRHPGPGQFDPVWLEEATSYLLEMAAALHEFLSACKPAVEIGLMLELPHRIPHVYQKIYSQLYEMLENRGEIVFDWSRYETLINQWLAMGRSEFVSVFHGFACHCLDAILGLKDDRQELEKYLEMYIRLMSTALDDDLFVRDYNKAHSMAVQFQMLVDNIADFDKTQTDYLLDSLAAITAESESEEERTAEDVFASTSFEQATAQPFPQDVYESIYDTLTQYLEIKEATGEADEETEMFPEPVSLALKQYVQLRRQWEDNPNCWQTQSEQFEPTAGGSQQMDPYDYSSEIESIDKVNRPNEEEIEKRIRTVLEMLPDLGAGFVLKCLERMDYKPEQVISKVLDEDLPSDLVEISRGLPRGALDSLEMPGPSGMVQRKPEPRLIGYTGKKPGYADARDLLDDKKEKADIKNFVLQASYSYDVDDDYDDRNQVYNSFENDDESKIYRHLKQSDDRDCNVVSDPSSSSEDEARAGKSKDAFCEDPAVIRARREAQRGRSFRGSKGPPIRDVTGRPKGQGQDKTVQQNRDKKNVNKSSKGNHNRRGGAQWKRSRGMIPS